MKGKREGIKKLYAGDFNYMAEETLPDGSMLITLVKEGDKHIYKMKVKDLYGKNEEVLEEEVKEL